MSITKRVLALVAILGSMILAILVAEDTNPYAQAAPGDHSPFEQMVCGTMNNNPSVIGVRRAMNSVSTFVFVRGIAWDHVVNSIVWGCPEYADLAKEYANFYGTAG